MGIIKVLKRKDGATLVVAIALGFIVGNFISTVGYPLASKLAYVGQTDQAQGSGPGWRFDYLIPTLTLIAGIIILELLIWIYVWIHGAVTGGKK